MSYKIELIDIKIPEIENKLRFLIQEAFQMKEPIPPGYLLKNTITNKASKETIFLAAIENDEIIGCNGFMATDFCYNGDIITCYQSCWTATHPKHQGRKIFVNIINESKKILKEREAGFIYGLGNDNSHPILIKKLGFKEIPSLMVKIPNIPFLKDSYFKRNKENNEFYKSSTFYPIEEQIIDLKVSSGRNIIEIKFNNSFLWGKLCKSPAKLGIRFNYFYIGGMDLYEPEDLKKLCNQVFKKYNVQYIQIVTCKKNLYNNLLNNWGPTAMNGFIFYELNSPVENINILYGAIDVF